MENITNTVNLSLSEYENLRSNASVTRDLLNKVTAELDVLREQKKDKVIVIERRPGPYNGPTETLQLDVNDPQTSAKILDIISKVDNSELSQKIEEKETEIKKLKNSLNDSLEAVENIERAHKYNSRVDEDAKKEEIRKLRKGYEETILDLEIDKETLLKTLKDLKVNKTKEQLEVERQLEINNLNEKILALEEYKKEVEHLNFFSFRKFHSTWVAARNFISSNNWFNKLQRRTNTALENLREYGKIMEEVGKLPETNHPAKEQGKCKSAFSVGLDSWITTTACSKW